MTALNPSFYNWSSPIPGIYRRPVLSTEALWFTKPKELHEIFVTVDLGLIIPRARSELKQAAERAWKLLRFEVPELGARAIVQDGEVFLEYRVVDEDGIGEWIGRTLLFHERRGTYEFEALREAISSRKESDEQASVLLNFPTQGAGGQEQEKIDNIQIILNIDHQITDGIGTRILLGRFLELFSRCIDDSQSVSSGPKWEDSYKNLTRPWIEMLDTKQKLEGRELEELVERKRDYLYHKIVFISPFIFCGLIYLRLISRFLS